MPYVGAVQSLSNMTAGTSGVALPVPRKSAVIGRAMVFVNSSVIRKGLNNSLSGTRAKRTSNHRMTLSIVINR